MTSSNPSSLPALEGIPLVRSYHNLPFTAEISMAELRYEKRRQKHSAAFSFWLAYISLG